MSDKKFFPIHTATACRLKWSWSTLYLNNGKTASCHRASFSKLTADTFGNFHNTDEKVKARELMLEGQWPGDGCEHCRDIEQHSNLSDRLFQNTVPNEYPLELDVDSTLTQVDPSVLEIFFKNTCNLACLYCEESLSSRIATENRIHGKLVPTVGIPATGLYHPDDSDNKYNEFVELFWQWLDTGYSKLQRINILGGEPFIQDDLDRLFDYIEQHPNPKLEVSIISNLILKTTKLEQFCARVKQMIAQGKLKQVKILASVDCWGQEQEYIRHGFDCDIFEKNVQYLLTQKYLHLSIMSVVTSLSINTLPMLAGKFVEWNKHRTIHWYVNNLLPFEDNVLRATIFDYTLFKQAIEETVKLMPASASDTFLGIVKHIEQATEDLPTQHKLLEYLTEIDRRRNLDWKQTFPWLLEEFKRCGIIK